MAGHSDRGLQASLPSHVLGRRLEWKPKLLVNWSSTSECESRQFAEAMLPAVFHRLLAVPWRNN